MSTAHTSRRVGAAILGLAILAALLAPLLTPYRPAQQLDITGLQNARPSSAHLLGTDVFSRDVLARVLFGARVSLGIGALAAAVAVGVGTLVGTAAGYARRWVDGLLMRLVDVGLAVPRIFIVLAAIAVGRRLDAVPLALLLGLTGWFATSRLVRAEVLALRDQPFVDAAHALGAGPWRVMLRHLVPNVAGIVVVSTALGVANMMLLEAALSFLGVGVQPPAPSWGNMIADGRDYLLSAPWVSLAPGIAITVVVMALHAVADRGE